MNVVAYVSIIRKRKENKTKIKWSEDEGKTGRRKEQFCRMKPSPVL